MLVLDSNTISYYFRGDPQVVPQLQALRPADLRVPAIVGYELRYALHRLPEPAATPRLAALAQFLGPLQMQFFFHGNRQVAVFERAESLRHPFRMHDPDIAPG